MDNDVANKSYRPPVTGSDQIRAALATQMIALSVGVSLEAMTAPRRGPRACRARWLSIYLAHVGYGWPLDRVAYAFGVSRATAGQGCRWSEDARDDAALDALLDRLERQLRDLCEAPKLELAA